MEIKNSNRAMWKGALIPAIALSAISLIMATLFAGSAGLYGAGLACVTVLIFFSVSLLVARLTRDANPITTMALAMFSYFTKLILMALFLLAVTRLTQPETVDRTSFGLSALAITFAWLTGEVRSFFKLRLELTPKHE
jgi:ATP synthase protein I